MMGKTALGLALHFLNRTYRRTVIQVLRDRAARAAFHLSRADSRGRDTHTQRRFVVLLFQKTALSLCVLYIVERDRLSVSR